eukprot:125114-Rhodomonas_salina.2
MKGSITPVNVTFETSRSAPRATPPVSPGHKPQKQQRTQQTNGWELRISTTPENETRAKRWGRREEDLGRRPRGG